MERSARLVNKNIISKYTLTSNAKGSQKYDLFWLNPTCWYLFGTISGLLEVSSRDVRRLMSDLRIWVHLPNWTVYNPFETIAQKPKPPEGGFDSS